MAGNTNFPTALDDDVSLVDVTDGVTALQAAHHNNLKEAIKALEAKVGVFNTSAPTALDARLGHPTIGHAHGGASGDGQVIQPSAIPAPSGAVGTAVTVRDHLIDAEIHLKNNAVFHFVKTFRSGSVASGVNQFIPITISETGSPTSPDYLRLVEVSSIARRAPSGATTTIDINFSNISIWTGINAQRLRLGPGATYDWRGTFANATYIVGDIITVDIDTVGSQAPGEDISINFTFRE